MPDPTPAHRCSRQTRFKIESTPIVFYNALIGEAVGRSLGAADSAGFYRMVQCAACSHCWIDPTSFQLVRLEYKALDIPKNFPIIQSEGSTDYDLTDIEGKKYWLPVRAEVLLLVDLVDRGVRLHTRNVIEFKRYRKFEAEVRIVPD